MKFIRCQAMRSVVGANEYLASIVAMVATTFEHARRRASFSDRMCSVIDLGKPQGIFECYICRDCGFAELYVREPSSIPIGPEYATEIFDVSTDSPYR